MSVIDLPRRMAKCGEPSSSTGTLSGDRLPPVEDYEDIAGHPRYQDDPTSQHLDAEGVGDECAFPSDVLSGSHLEHCLNAVLSRSGHGPANVAIKTVWKSIMTQMMALSHRGQPTKAPILGPQGYPVAALCRELVDPGNQAPFPLPITGMESVIGLDGLQDLQAAIRSEKLVTVTTPRQVRIAKELASIRGKYGCYAPIMVVKHHGCKAETALQYVPHNGKAINVLYPDLPRLIEEAQDLASMLRPDLMSLMRCVSQRWATERVNACNADTPDGIRWLWLVADELNLSSLQFNDLNWAMHRSIRYFPQSRDLLVRI